MSLWLRPRGPVTPTCAPRPRRWPGSGRQRSIPPPSPAKRRVPSDRCASATRPAGRFRIPWECLRRAPYRARGAPTDRSPRCGRRRKAWPRRSPGANRTTPSAGNPDIAPPGEDSNPRHGRPAPIDQNRRQYGPTYDHQFTLVGVKQDASYFEDKEPVLIYIGKKLRDSVRLEEIFTAAGVDYGVEADEYRGGVIFRSVRAGAFFYVLPEAVDAAHEIMRRNGYKPYLGEA